MQKTYRAEFSDKTKQYPITRRELQVRYPRVSVPKNLDNFQHSECTLVCVADFGPPSYDPDTHKVERWKIVSYSDPSYPEVSERWDYKVKPLAGPERAQREALINAQEAQIIDHELELELKAVKAGYQDVEIETWDQQMLEAKAYLADSNATVPMLDAMAAESGDSKTVLANSIMTKANAFAAAAGAVLGRKRKKRKNKGL